MRAMIMSPLVLALLAALLFGASTPASKALLADLSPLALAGLLYTGAALGAAPLAFRQRRQASGRRLHPRDLRGLALVVVFGGIIGPLLLLMGLRMTTGGSV